MFLRLRDEMERRNVLWKEDAPRLSEHPYIVCIIDEFQLFIDGINQMKGSETIVKTINDILRYGRHVKIHLILAIHNPKSDIAFIDKSDLPVQLAFQTVDSRKSITAMGASGAEKLHGKGDMLFRYRSRSTHLKGVFMSDDEIDLEINGLGITSYSFPGEEDYSFSISDEGLQGNEESAIDLSFISSMKEAPNSENENERKFATIALWTLTQSVVSINSIQHCGIFQNSSVGNDFAKKCFERLRSFEILGDKDSKGRLMVIPQSVEEVPGELKELLSRYGISDDNIIEAISKRQEQ